MNDYIPVLLLTIAFLQLLITALKERELLVKFLKVSYKKIQISFNKHKALIENKIIPITALIQKILFGAAFILLCLHTIANTINGYSLLQLIGLTISYVIMFYSFSKILIDTDKKVRLKLKMIIE